MKYWSLLLAVAIPCSLLGADRPARVSLLYVQSAGSGTFEPLADSKKFRLVLHDVAPSVVYFSDRPNRLAGQVSMRQFLGKIGFGGKLDPNAAIDISGAPSQSDLIVAALDKPVYDPLTRTLSYEVTVLNAAREGLASFSARMDKRLPARFGPVAVFIDDAPCGDCSKGGQCCPGFFCYDPGAAPNLVTPRCAPCQPGKIYDPCGGVD